MAHEIEQDGSGRAAFVSGGNVDPWHRLGKVLPGGLTAEQALGEAFLRDWDVRKVPVCINVEQLTDDGVTSELVEVPGQFAVVRTNPFTKRAEPIGDPGGVVGRIYKPFQNEQAVDFLAGVTDQFGDAEFETAGSIRKGSQVFITMRLKEFTVGGVDGHTMYLVYIVNHTTGSNLCFPTNIRVVCANTADWAVESAIYRFRHSASIEAKHAQVRDALRLAFDYDAMFEAEAEKLIREPMELTEFFQFVTELWPEPEREGDTVEDVRTFERAHKRWMNQRAVLRQLFLFADTLEEVRLTRWGAYNVVTEYMDHLAPSGGRTTAQKQTARALRTIDGTPIKKKAFDLLRVP